MYNTAELLRERNTPKTKSDILGRISEYDVYAKYMGNFKIGTLYKSPLREDPSR
jgi:hypothetical protein